MGQAGHTHDGRQLQDSGRRKHGFAHIGLMLCLAWAIAACSDAATTPAPDAGADGLAKDVTVTTADGDVAACPGGPGCACASASDCASGHCLAALDGTLACAVPCGTLGCGPGRGCGSLPVGPGQGLFCIERAVHLCEPCTATTDCRIEGLPGAACVDYGNAGAFCGAGCLGDSDCGEGYRCAVVDKLEGGQVQQCVRSGSGANLGECPCSAHAVAAKLSTVCHAQDGACKGVRSCGEAGLGACSAQPAAPEQCNGADDDCDGLTDEFTCDDNNACTTDGCDVAADLLPAGSLACKHVATDGPCTDGDACTAGDTCKDGGCAAGAKADCDDNNPCSTDTCDKLSGCVHAFAANMPCDDGDACTAGEVCQAGKCATGKLIVCDDKNPCTEDKCSPATGMCVSSAYDGGACNDGDLCTSFDTCKGGSCAGKPDGCDDENPCTIDSCDSKNGCVYTAGSGPCSDGNPCTTGEACSGSKCQGGAVKVCASPDPCLVAFCSAATGSCASQIKANGTACSDGSACSTADACKGGQCLGQAADCDDGNPCTDDSCDATAGCKHAANVAPCSDGNACTSGDACQAGKCTGAPLDVPIACDDKNDCTTDACDTKVGCAHVAKTGSCDDANACTVGDVCGNGACVSGTNQCTCQSNADCASQEDGNPCNGTLICDKASGGACKIDATTVVSCDPGGDTVCEKNQCVPSTGKCALQTVNEGLACDDADTCTTGDVCANGACKGSLGPCDDSNPCTDDSCDKIGGCVHTANSATCDADGSLCTADACSSKVCLPGTAVKCDDANDCTTESCDAKTGKCVFTAVADAASCSDGDPCTTPDACKAGKCLGTIPAGSTLTLAGNGSAGFAEGKGTVAKFTLAGTESPNTRAGLALGPNQVIYVADTGNQRIRKVLPDGTVSTLAGVGTFGFTDGPGEAAEFWDPAAVAVGSDGTVYVADRLNQRIRKVLANGTTSTLAGDAPAPEFGAAKAVGGFADGKGTAAQFDEPAGIAWAPDGLALYVVEAANHRVRKVLLDGTVTTVAGSGTAAFADGKGAAASFDKPTGIAVAADGTIFVSDTGNLRIRAIAADGTVTTIAGSGAAGSLDGTALGATFKQPWGLAIGSDGALFVADALGHTIRKLAAGMVTTLAGTGAAGNQDDTLAKAQFNQPVGIAVLSPGVWYVADALNHRIRKLTDPTVACPPK